MEEPHLLELAARDLGLGTVLEPVRLPQPHAARQQRDGRVEPAGVAQRGQQQRHHDHHPAVDDDLPCDHLVGGDDREHRHAHARVVLLDLHGQRPVVRRRPEEHHPEEDDRRPGHRVGHGRPADEHREAAGDAAPDDVLRGAALEDHRVDDHVEEERAEGEPGRQPVDGEAEEQGGDDGQGDAEDEAFHRADHAGHQGPLRGAVHQRVDVAVDVHVQRVRAAGREVTADTGQQHQPQIRNTLFGEEHHRNRGDQQKLDDPRLGQRHERLDTGPERPVTRALARPDYPRRTGFNGRHAHP